MAKDKVPQFLQDMASEVDQGFIEDTFEVFGRKFKLRLLSDGENNWKNRYVDVMVASGALISQNRAPTLAVAIREIDGQPMDKIFPDPVKPADDASDEEKQSYERWNRMSKLERQFERCKQMYEYLSNRPDDFVIALHEKFMSLRGRREEVLKNLKKS